MSETRELAHAMIQATITHWVSDDAHRPLTGDILTDLHAAGLVVIEAETLRRVDATLDEIPEAWARRRGLPVSDLRRAIAARIAS